MMTITPRSILFVLFDLARADRPATVDRIAARLGTSPNQVRQRLDQLERLKLVDAQRVRLTLAGLAIATSLSANRTLPHRLLDAA